MNRKCKTLENINFKIWRSQKRGQPKKLLCSDLFNSSFDQKNNDFLLKCIFCNFFTKIKKKNNYFRVMMKQINWGNKMYWILKIFVDYINKVLHKNIVVILRAESDFTINLLFLKDNPNWQENLWDCFLSFKVELYKFYTVFWVQNLNYVIGMYSVTDLDNLKLGQILKF